MCATHLTSALPEQMRDEVFQYLVDRYAARGAQFPDFFAYTDYLGDFIDLLNLDYDEQRDPLFPEDWEYLRDIMSDFAEDLDMGVVSYTMGLVLKKGYIG